MTITAPTTVSVKTTTTKVKMVGRGIFATPARIPDEHNVYTKSESRLFHNACGYTLTVEEYGTFRKSGFFDPCPKCGEASINYFNFSPILTDEAKSITARPETMKDMIWYHATPHDTWQEDLKEEKFDIHAGTLMAAYERLFATGDTKNYIHALRLKPEAVISPFIKDDDHDLWMKDEHDVQGYYNEWEDCGSISIVCAWDAFEVIESSTISKASLKRLKSPYNC